MSIAVHEPTFYLLLFFGLLFCVRALRRFLRTPQGVLFIRGISLGFALMCVIPVGLANLGLLANSHPARTHFLVMAGFWAASSWAATSVRIARGEEEMVAPHEKP